MCGSSHKKERGEREYSRKILEEIMAKYFLCVVKTKRQPTEQRSSANHK